MSAHSSKNEQIFNTVAEIATTILLVAGCASAAHADIFQWEYVNPADASQGKRQSTTLAPDGAGVDAVPGASLGFRNLTKAYLIGADLTGAIGWYSNLTNADLKHANLTNANFEYTTLTNAGFRDANFANANFYAATLSDADFTNAEVRGANFSIDVGCGHLSCPRHGTGITTAQLYATASYQANDLSGIGLNGSNLADGDFSGQNLTNAVLENATLTDTDFTAASLSRANFSSASLADADFSKANVTNANFGVGDLTDANFHQANLANANFTNIICNDIFCTGGWATLTDADLTAADARGATGLQYFDAMTTNLIHADGHISRLDLEAGELLAVRDHDGNPGIYYDPGQPIPVTVDQHLRMGPGGTLRMVFEADAWDSTISFAPGIPVTLGGTLELNFAADVNPASQIGRTFDVFDWTGVNPTGAFAIASPYSWDLSKLYSTGEVTLVGVPEPSALALFAWTLLIEASIRRRSWLSQTSLVINSRIAQVGES